MFFHLPGGAEALAAQSEQPVCIVDSNLRLPSLHMCLGVDNSQGLGEALVNGGPIRNMFRSCPLPTCGFFPAGGRPLP